MLSHALLMRLVSYSVLLGLARLFTVVAGAWYCYRHQLEAAGPKTFRGFLRFFFPRQIWTSASVRIDLSLVVLRKLTGAWGVVPVAASIALLAPIAYNSLTAAFGVHEQQTAPMLVNLGVVVALLLIHDFCEYAVHAASHHNRILWEFHKAHHSTEFMTPLSAKRSHFVDDLARMAVIGPALGFSVGILGYLLDLSPVQSSLFGFDAYVIGNLLSFEQLRHSHIPLTYGPAEAYLMSPAQHQLHHNRYGKPQNFGSFLALWDRLFGTYSRSVPAGSFEVGISPADQPHYDAVWKLYVRPFWNLGLHAKRSLDRRRMMAEAALMTSSNASNT